jgi:hypothetical protein
MVHDIILQMVVHSNMIWHQPKPGEQDSPLPTAAGSVQQSPEKVVKSKHSKDDKPKKVIFCFHVNLQF